MKQSIGPKTMLCIHPDLIVATYDSQGRPNAMAVAWGGICSSNPPCVAISVQKYRYTYTNLMEHEAFTVNIPSQKFVAEADFFGIESGERVDKFEATGLSTEKAEHVNAPIIREFPMVLECRLLQTVEIGVHTQFIGEIVDVKVDEEMLDENGRPDINKIQPIIYDPASISYYGVGALVDKAFNPGKTFKK